MMISLPDLHVLEITGADAVNFAQAQFSNDVRSIRDGEWQWSAWLSPQGRVRAFFHLLRDDGEHLRLLLRGGSTPAIRAALAPYVLRAKVGLHVSEERVCGTYEPAANGVALPGPRSRWLLVANAAGDDFDASPASREQWRLDDIRAGLPVLAADLQDQLLPQWLGLERLGAVSVKKGCYPGQEVMSRLHFKGGNKRSLYRIELAGSALPEAGMALPLQDTSAGQVIMAARREDGSIEALASLTDTIGDLPVAAVLTGASVLERFA